MLGFHKSFLARRLRCFLLRKISSGARRCRHPSGLLGSSVSFRAPKWKRACGPAGGSIGLALGCRGGSWSGIASPWAFSAGSPIAKCFAGCSHFVAAQLRGVRPLPDTPANDRAFGRPGNQKTLSAFPHARIVAMCEIGSHVLWRLQIKPYRRGEGPMAD